MGGLASPVHQVGWEVKSVDEWSAYPLLQPGQHAYAPFQLMDGLYYVNAIENAVSAMEVSTHQLYVRAFVHFTMA